MTYQRTFFSLSLALLLAACSQNRIVPPGFAGVPEAQERSADYELRLHTTAREPLVAYLAGARGEDGFPDAARERAVEAQYGALLQTLHDRELRFRDLVELFAPERPLAIHDARVDFEDEEEFFDLDLPRCCGFVRGEYVWVFYRQRLVPIDCDPPHLRAWQLAAARDASADPPYAGLLVFPKSFAIATPAH